MVMGRANWKDLLRTVRKTMGRFLAILAIIALGSGFLAGLRCTTSAMTATAQRYVDAQALFDLRVMNTYGWTQEDVEEYRLLPGIRAAEGSVSLDVLAAREDREGEIALRLLSITRDVSRPELQAGRMPEKAGECLADGFVYSERDIGKTFYVADTNKDATRENLAVDHFTVVGLCSSPLFMNFERGSTTVGNGSLTAFLYVPQTTFDMDGVYTEIQLKLDQNYTIYSQEYADRLESETDRLEPFTESLAQHRYEKVQQQARWDIEEGQREYDEGLAAYRREKADAEAQLAEALEKVTEGKAELDENQEKLEAGRKELEEGQAQLDYGWTQLSTGEKTLQTQKAETFRQFADTEKMLSQQLAAARSGERQLLEGIALVDDGLAQIHDGLDQIEQGLTGLNVALTVANTGLAAARSLLDAASSLPIGGAMDAYIAALEERIAESEAQVAELEAQRAEVEAQRGPLEEKRDEVLAQKAELQDQLAQVREGIDQILSGQEELESGRRQAEDSFKAAEAQLEASRLELTQGQETLDESRKTLEEAQAQLDEGWAAWEEGKTQYDEARQEADTQFADAWRELEDGKRALADGRKALAEMEPPTSYVLDRTTNVAYVCFESDAGIVAGISKIFPLFFFAVAALVCLTTMSKMVDEERTQIGIKKALGYSSLAISSKFLLYSGAASLAGCLLGVAMGSVIFPKVIWMGYQIMYNFSPDIVLSVDVPLCSLIVVSFTVCMLAVTWFCCRQELRDVPAQLIRPRAPKAGRRLLLERMFFWKYLSFLQKVSLRNIFRYKKRLVMMLLGVGGCTALVITGLGLGDTIVGIADTQYTQVTVYDMAVNFGENQTPEDREHFLENLTGTADGVEFCHMSTVDVSFDSTTKSVSLLAAGDSLEGYFNLHRGKTPVEFPAEGEALINTGLARSMEIEVGDTLTVRNADMEQMQVRVSGIFDNSVYNYVLLSQATLQKEWGHEGSVNYALVNTPKGMDAHSAAASVSRQKGVVNVTVSEDMMTRVESMLQSMNYIVLMVILCAAALAFIVMYNLTNINITERIREIATIKVLGFYAGESAAYVFREGLALTVMGAAAGSLAGKYLHAFVIDKIRIDMVYFAPRVDAVSYGLAVVLTLLFAALVDFFLYFKLEKINMAEALKSVE